MPARCSSANPQRAQSFAAGLAQTSESVTGGSIQSSHLSRAVDGFRSQILGTNGAGAWVKTKRQASSTSLLLTRRTQLVVVRGSSRGSSVGTSTMARVGLNGMTQCVAPRANPKRQDTDSEIPRTNLAIAKSLVTKRAPRGAGTTCHRISKIRSAAMPTVDIM